MAIHSKFLVKSTFCSSFTKLPYHTMGVLPSTQPVATPGSSLFCLPLIWLARVVYLLVGVAEGWGGRRGHAYPCAVLGHAMLHYSVGVGVGVVHARQ